MIKNNKSTVFYKIIRPIIKGFIVLFFHPKIIGKENIIDSGKLVLAGNHTNNFDCLLLISATKRQIHFLAKNELWQGPKKIIFSNLGLIPVNRKTKDPQALKSAIEYLNSNNVIGIFPEGTTEKGEKKLLPFKIGAVKMAKVTNAPIVPFAITGDYKLFSKNLILKFGKPFYIQGDDLTTQNDQLKIKIDKLRKGEE